MIDRKKADLRKIMRDRLKNLSPPARSEAGILIASHIDHWLKSYHRIRMVALFQSLCDEINTEALDKVLAKNNITRCIPWIESLQKMMFIKLSVNTPINYYCFGYLKPLPDYVTSQDFINIVDLDAIFIPGLAFDKQGRRLGRGQGHYDRALALVAHQNKRPILVGVAMDTQIAAQVPCEEHDVPMDYLLTPDLGMFKIF